MNIKKIPKSLIVVVLFLTLILLLFSSIYVTFIGYEVSIILIIGFILFIVFFFIYINSNFEKHKDPVFQFKFLSENFLKLFLLIVFIIAVFIPASTTNKSIINWEYVTLFNYIKAIFIIVSCAFLPGANLYNIFFRKDEISKKFAIESFFVKIALYPLISFGFIGIVVLIFDQVGVIRDLSLIHI